MILWSVNHFQKGFETDAKNKKVLTPDLGIQQAEARFSIIYLLFKPNITDK